MKLMADYGATVSTDLYGDYDFTVIQRMPVTGPWAYSFGQLFLGISSIHFRDATLDDDAWDAIASLDAPMILIFENCKIKTTKDTFSQLPNLHRLHFRNTNVSPKQMQEILSQPYLKDLRFEGCNDEVLNWLEPIVQKKFVSSLHITGHPISNKSLRSLMQRDWWGISLANCQIDFSEIDKLPPYISITKLDLSNTNVDDDFVMRFKFHNLEQLDVSGTKITTQSLRNLAERAPIDEISMDTLEAAIQLHLLQSARKPPSNY